VLLLGHLDTVWPLGTLRERPLRREGPRLYGPGTFDMKGGLPPLAVLFTPNEEVDCGPTAPAWRRR
jgi:acetylornithine deacetylase/succinyl-diaminopimelate desuccinylase-like protein